MEPPVIAMQGPGDQAAVVARVVKALRAGGVIVLPTDTVYGLVALPTDGAAVERVFELKGRSTATPLAVLCADLTQALELADERLAAALTLVGERWWPGPLTLVVPRRAGVGLHLGEPDDTVGLRVPDDPLVAAVARRVGPIAATSANRHREPTPTSASGVVDALGQGLALVVDGGERSIAASTVIDATVEPWQVLRAGPVDAAEVVALARASGDPDR